MKLARREKIYVFLTVFSTITYLLVQFVIFPVMEKKQNLENEVQVKTKVVRDITGLKEEYEINKKKASEAKERYAKRKSNFKLFSFLDGLAGDVGIKSNVVNMKPSKTKEKDNPYTVASVEMKLKAITTEQLVSFLYKVEKSNNDLKVKRMLIKDAKKNEGYVDVELKVMTLEM